MVLSISSVVKSRHCIASEVGEKTHDCPRTGIVFELFDALVGFGLCASNCVESALNNLHELFPCWIGVVGDEAPVTDGCW